MKVVENFDLTNYNSYRLKAFCHTAVFPTREEDFIEIYSNPKIYQDPIMLGGGYNVILSKENYDRTFIIVGDSFSKIELISDNTILCQAGVNTEALSNFALENCLSGAEIFYDIPSSIGGAVVMNAGASGEEIKDILDTVRYLDLSTMKVCEIQKSDINFKYRNSLFQQSKGKVILSATFKLAPGNSETIKEKMETVKAARWKKQPRDFPNAGSVFKRPPGFYVGAMIEELNLKGFTVGGAKISEKHGGFIINFNGATGEDILNIISSVKQKVQERFGVDLEIEQRII